MIKSLLYLALLLTFPRYAFADEELSQVLNDVLRGIPGRSAVWTETFRPFYGWPAEYPFFSPAIVRIGNSEDYSIVQSDLFIFDKEAYSVSCFFTVLSPDDQLSLEVIPASGVKVTYQLNVPTRFPPGVVQDRILSAETMLREYGRLERQVQGGFVISTYVLTGLLSVAGCVWIATNGSATSGLKAYGVFLGISSPVLLGFGISAILSDSSNGRKMEEIRKKLRSLWQ